MFSRLSPVCPTRIIQGKNPPKFHMSQAASWKIFDWWSSERLSGSFSVSKSLLTVSGWFIDLLFSSLSQHVVCKTGLLFREQPCEILQASTLIKKKIKFSSYLRKFRGIGCKIWLMASSYMVKIFVHFLIHILGTPSSYTTLHPIQSEFHIGKFCFLFYQCIMTSLFCTHYTHTQHPLSRLNSRPWPD